MPALSDVSALLRGTAVGASSALVTAGAHTFGGGMFPSEAALVLLALVCAAIGYAVAVSPVLPAPRVQLLLTLAAAQSVGHLLLTLVDGHHHGSIMSTNMLAAHGIAVVVGALAIRGAERGLRRAATSLRAVVPLLAALVVDDSRIAPPLPVYRIPGSARLLDLSGRGSRGPPARTA